MEGIAPLEAQVPTSPPSYREIFRFYFPLALSWIFMALELPIETTIVSRSAHAEIQTAALLMLAGLSLWIESPVIDLLATSTTLAKNAISFEVISRFVWWLMGWCTLLHAAIALTPLYDVVARQWLGVPAEVAEAARLPMAVMIPWSAFIGWRRYLQGILIRFGQTKIIGWGTVVRVATMAGVGSGLFFLTNLPGVMIAATGLVCSVFSEAMFIHWASRNAVSAYLRRDPGNEGITDLETDGPRYEGTKRRRKTEIDGRGDQGLSMGRLAKFHLPLTATTMAYLLSFPLISSAIARSPDSVLAMASWQVAGSMIFLFRTVVFALPEPVIALYKGRHTSQPLARFCFMVGAAASISMVVLWSIGGDRFIFGKVFGAQAAVVVSASLAFLACVFLPLIGAVQSYLRGMLTAHHFTLARLASVAASMSVLVLCLFVGVRRGWPGVTVAAFALNLSTMSELGALALSWRLATRRLNKKSPEPELEASYP